MKRKILSLFLCSVMLSGVMCSCASKDKVTDLSQNGNSASTVDNSSTIPDDVKERLKEVHDAEPVKLPAEEWNFETICSSIYINSKQFSYPCTINDLGEEFEIIDNEEYKLKYDKEKKMGSIYLTYYGNIVCNVRVDDCEDIADIADSPIGAMVFMQEMDEDAVFPVSFNGVTIGDNAERILDRLSFLEVRSKELKDGSKYYSFSSEKDGLRIYCSCLDDCVTNISFNLT